MESRRLCFNASSFPSTISFLANGESLFRGGAVKPAADDSTKKRPFFTVASEDYYYDDEYFDDQLPEKKRRLTAEQVHLLERSFEEDNKLEPERKSELAKGLGLQPRQVAIWFQNRRARWKAKQLEKDYDDLKSSYHSLLSDYESILLQNGKLKSEIVWLREKVHGNEGGGGVSDGSNEIGKKFQEVEDEEEEEEEEEEASNKYFSDVFDEEPSSMWLWGVSATDSL